MEVINRLKNMPWQITRIMTDKGFEVIEIKKFWKNPHGGFSFNKFERIFCNQAEWKKLKNWIKGKEDD